MVDARLEISNYHEQTKNNNAVWSIIQQRLQDSVQ